MGLLQDYFNKEIQLQKRKDKLEQKGRELELLKDIKLQEEINKVKQKNLDDEIKRIRDKKTSVR